MISKVFAKFVYKARSFCTQIKLIFIIFRSMAELFVPQCPHVCTLRVVNQTASRREYGNSYIYIKFRSSFRLRKFGPCNRLGPRHLCHLRFIRNSADFGTAGYRR